MIVLLDANALIKTPFHQPSWRIIGLSGKEWGLGVQIPWVSALEVIGHAQRALEDDVVVLKKVAGRNRQTPGLAEALKDILTRKDSLEEQFVADAEAVGASLIDSVHVPPLDMVRRQTARRKPCKKDGNGYRDTLNWLTVLDVAAANPDQEIVWVSEDGDFTGKDGNTFHQDLLDEADERGVVDRIALRSSLGSVVTDFLTKYGLSTNLNDARKNLAEKAIRAFVLETVLPTLVDMEPVSQFDYVIWPVVDEIEVGKPAGIDHGGAAWPFTAQVQLTMDPGSSLPAHQVTVNGLVTTDKFDKATGGEISDVSLPPEAQATANLIREFEASAAVQIFAADLQRKNAAIAEITKTLGTPSPALLAKLTEISSVSGVMERIASQINSPTRRMQEQMIASMATSIDLQGLREAQMAPLRKFTDQIARNNQSLIASFTRNFPVTIPVPPAQAKPKKGSSKKKGTEASKLKTSPETPTTEDNEPQ